MLKRFSAVLATCILVFLSSTTAAFCETAQDKPSGLPAVGSDSAVLTELDTGKVLYEKDSHKKEYPASLTKILTALLVLDNLDLDKTITVGKEINLVGKDASSTGLSVGEKITGKDLIWAIMLPSGNDAAYTAAVTVAREKSGNASMDVNDAVAYFSSMMNKRAQELGARDSHFTNPDGYPDENHYSSAYDMALISSAAMKNSFFKQVAGTYSFELKGQGAAQADGKVKGASIWYNKNQLINPKSKYYYQPATGIKTGSTSAAGYCLASSASKNSETLIAIVLKAKNEDMRCTDTKNLFEYGFNNFKYNTLLKKGETIGTLKVNRKYFGGGVEVEAVSSKEFGDMLTDVDASAVKRNIVWDKSLVASEDVKTGEVTLLGPISAGQVLGTVSLTLNGNVLVKSDIIAANDALKGDITDKVVNVLDYVIKYKYAAAACVIIIILAFIVLAVFIRRSNGRNVNR